MGVWAGGGGGGGCRGHDQDPLPFFWTPMLHKEGDEWGSHFIIFDPPILHILRFLYVKVSLHAFLLVTHD